MSDSDSLWKQYQGLNQRYLDTVEYIEKLSKELDELREKNWRAICTKSLQQIRNEIIFIRMRDEQLTNQNKKLNVEISNYKKEVDQLIAKRKK